MSGRKSQKKEFFSAKFVLSWSGKNKQIEKTSSSPKQLVGAWTPAGSASASASAWCIGVHWRQSQLDILQTVASPKSFTGAKIPQSFWFYSL